jgi:hypothetical protein
MSHASSMVGWSWSARSKPGDMVRTVRGLRSRPDGFGWTHRASISESLSPIEQAAHTHVGYACYYSAYKQERVARDREVT